MQEKFEQFGNCYVKIKRDSRGMPFAFCQYEVSLLINMRFFAQIC